MVCPLGVRIKGEKKKAKSFFAFIEKTFLACMLCFPITDRVMVPQRIVSFKCRPMQVHPCAFVCMIIKRQKANSLENITWSELGKQNMQAKKVYSKYTWSSSKVLKLAEK